jgi:hypothetical protein
MDPEYAKRLMWANQFIDGLRNPGGNFEWLIYFTADSREGSEFYVRSSASGSFQKFYARSTGRPDEWVRIRTPRFWKLNLHTALLDSNIPTGTSPSRVRYPLSLI